jgi:hypothetical protein
MFEHAELKIERAEKHIVELQTDIRKYIEKNPHTVSVKFDPNVRCDVLSLFGPQKPVPEKLALPIGDAIHNLHTALDFMWYEFVCTFTDPDEFVKLPFRDTRDGVKGAINGRKPPQSSQSVVDYILDVIQPYEGGNNLMIHLHNLDITDKHGYLIPRLHMTAIWHVCAETETGTKIQLPDVRVVMPFVPSSIRTFERNVKITDHGEMTVTILFYQGPLEGYPVEQTLLGFARKLREFLGEFRAMVSAVPL